MEITHEKVTYRKESFDPYQMGERIVNGAEISMVLIRRGGRDASLLVERAKIAYFAVGRSNNGHLGVKRPLERVLVASIGVIASHSGRAGETMVEEGKTRHVTRDTSHVNTIKHAVPPTSNVPEN
ncbi:hypothetical protein B0H13DRAFT_1881965 [Mycena leptocephala]|nr:hypothetical protein B0H13DRAFT_1881965 [Mycena leptocephala]